MQRLLGVKEEYRCHPSLALASINRHGTFFGERFYIRAKTAAPIHTACLALGLDRWSAQLSASVNSGRATRCDSDIVDR